MRPSPEARRGPRPVATAVEGAPAQGAAPSPAGLRRFDGVERVAHWATAVLVLVLVATGLILYVPALSVAVGRRLLVEDVHVYAGIAVLVPLLVSAAGPWGRRLRRDLASMGRLRSAEVLWLRTLGRRGGERLGKFNPGQKLNACAVGGLLVVLLGTGLVLRWGDAFAVGWRTGATFVHDWFALAIVVLVLGHLALALAHPRALVSMVTGRIPASWRDEHAPAWRPAAEEDALVARD